MLAGTGLRNKFEFDDFVFDFDGGGSEERIEGEESHPFHDMFVVVNEGNDVKAVVDKEAEVDRSVEKKENNGLVLCKEEANVHEAEDEPQDLPIQQSHSSETLIKSKGSFGSLGSKSVESVGKLSSINLFNKRQSCFHISVNQGSIFAVLLLFETFSCCAFPKSTHDKSEVVNAC